MLPCSSLVPSPLPAAILSRARKMVWETEPTFLVRDVMITRYGIMADPALDRILPDKQAQDATTRTDFSDSFGISHSLGISHFPQTKVLQHRFRTFQRQLGEKLTRLRRSRSGWQPRVVQLSDADSSDDIIYSLHTLFSVWSMPFNSAALLPTESCDRSAI